VADTALAMHSPLQTYQIVLTSVFLLVLFGLEHLDYWIPGFCVGPGKVFSLNLYFFRTSVWTARFCPFDTFGAYQGFTCSSPTPLLWFSPGP